MTDEQFYVHTDIPPGMTIDEYRRSRPRESSFLRRVMAIRTRRSSRGRKDAGQARLGSGYGCAGTLP